MYRLKLIKLSPIKPLVSDALFHVFTTSVSCISRTSKKNRRTIEAERLNEKVQRVSNIKLPHFPAIKVSRQSISTRFFLTHYPTTVSAEIPVLQLQVLANSSISPRNWWFVGLINVFQKPGSNIKRSGPPSDPGSFPAKPCWCGIHAFLPMLDVLSHASKTHFFLKKKEKPLVLSQIPIIQFVR